MKLQPHRRARAAHPELRAFSERRALGPAAPGTAFVRRRDSAAANSGAHHGARQIRLLGRAEHVFERNSASGDGVAATYPIAASTMACVSVGGMS